jgi:osmotically-inducible protein OsmY
MAPRMRLLLFGAAAWFVYYAFRKPLWQSVDDDTLVTRVRVRLDQLLEQPGSVNIEVHEGRVTLTGPAADRELRPVLRALRRLPGVRHVQCRLTAHAA